MSDVSQGQSAPIEAAPVAEIQDSQIETKVETKEVEEKDNFLAPKFAALTRKEKQVRAMEQQIKQREAEVAQKLAEIEERSKKNSEANSTFESEFKKNPLKTMEKYGITFDQLTEMQLNEQNPTPEMLMRQMEEKLRAEMEEKYGKLSESLKQKEEREAKERYEAAVSSYKQELSTFVEQNAETYELIATNNATDLMFETAEAFYQQTGKVPDHEELAKAVEEHLEEQAKQILKLKKFQTAKPIEAKPSVQMEPKTAQTLSNTLAAEVPKAATKLISDEQSKKEAAKLLRWNE